MAERGILDAFDDCINRLAAGQTIDDCLHAHPQYATRLRPMLEAGMLVKRAQASNMEVMAAQDRIRFQVAQAVTQPPARREQPFRRLASLAAGLVLVLVVSVSAGALAQNSLPGDPLYGLKLTTESIILSLPGSNRAAQERFVQRRIEETARLLELKRSENVTFEGQLQAMEGNLWHVASLMVNVEPDTPGSANIHIGDQIRIEGFTTPRGELFAMQIILVEQTQIEATPTLTHTSVSTATPTFTPSPTPTNTLQPSQTPSYTPTRTPTLTITPDTSPTAATCTPALPPGWVSYRIQTGDTLSGLAARTNSTLEQLLTVNCLSDPRLIIVGQEIYLPRVPTAAASSTPASNDNSSIGSSSHSGGASQNNNDNSGNDNSNDDDNDDSNRGRGGKNNNNDNDD